MQTAQNPNDAPKRASQNLFPALTQGQKLAGCYVLKSEKHVSDTISIWLAHDEVLGKDVSLHFIPQPVRNDEKAMDELRNLTKRNRQLIHPSILRIYDLIEENEWSAISTDALEGECLAELRRKRTGGFFEVADVKPWLAQICHTLDDAHKIQLVHGDLSPEHLFADNDGRVVVANFGIGRCLRDALWRAAGAGSGVPPVENLSPQLLDGQVPTASDDVYATGVLLHELLAGRPPFSDPDIAGKIRNTPAPKVLERRSEIQKAGGPIPPSWEKVISSCLEKPSDQRPKSLADVSARLGLPKSGAKTEEPLESAPQIQPVASSPHREDEPIIPVVKKAWVGAKGGAPLFGGATVAKAVETVKTDGKLRDTEMDQAENGDGSDQEPALKNALSRDSHRSGSRRSGFPVTGAAAAALLAGLCVYAGFFGGFRKTGQADPAPVVRTESAEDSQYAPVKNPISVTNPIAETPSVKQPILEPILEKAPAEQIGRAHV